MAGLWGYLDPAEHAAMLLDEVRVAAYAGAIAAVVQPGDVVLDIGTGTGVLAMLAARAGARRVFAVDRTGVVELARRHVADNGLTGVVEVIRADLAALAALPEPPRVVVGELLGNFAPSERQHRVYAAARRLARPDAVMIPARYQLIYGVARGAGLRADLVRLADLHGVRMTALSERLRSRPAFVHVDAAELLGAEVAGPWIAADGPPPERLAAQVTVERDGELGAITVGFCAELAPDHLLRTAVGAPRTHWTQTLFPVDPPLAVRAGDLVDVELVPRIITNHATWAWTVRRGDDHRGGDAFASFVGDKADLLEQLRARPAATAVPSPMLRAWAAALGGELSAVAIDEMAARALAADPQRYPNLEEARQDVLALVAAAARADSRTG